MKNSRILVPRKQNPFITEITFQLSIFLRTVEFSRGDKMFKEVKPKVFRTLISMGL